MKSRKRYQWNLNELNAIRHIMKVQGSALLTNDMKQHAYVTLLEDGKLKSMERIRVAHCQAYLICDERYIYVQSYYTIIGIFDTSCKLYYSMGAYSMTTYQHERKALELLDNMGYHINKRYNLWKVDNFGRES